MGFGQTLREAREAKGFTVNQLASMTHIMAQTIEGLEAEDFSTLAAPIYGRGFVKLCCQALDLDPRPMVEEFMAIYNGEKPPAVRAAAPSPTVKTTPAEPDGIHPSPDDMPSAPSPEPPPDARPPDPMVTEEPPPVVPLRPRTVAPDPEPPAGATAGDLFDQTPPEPPKASVSRFAPPRPQDDEPAGRTFDMPAIPWRLVMLVIMAAGVIWAVVAGCGALYHALSSEDDAEPAGKEEVRTLKDVGENVAAPAAPRSPKPVKPLYID